MDENTNITETEFGPLDGKAHFAALESDYRTLTHDEAENHAVGLRCDIKYLWLQLDAHAIACTYYRSKPDLDLLPRHEEAHGAMSHDLSYMKKRLALVEAHIENPYAGDM